MRTKFPRIPLPRQRGGAHRVNREVNARDDIAERLNDFIEEQGREPDDLDVDDEDFYDYLMTKLDMTGGGY